MKRVWIRTTRIKNHECECSPGINNRMCKDYNFYPITNSLVPNSVGFVPSSSTNAFLSGVVLKIKNLQGNFNLWT